MRTAIQRYRAAAQLRWDATQRDALDRLLDALAETLPSPTPEQVERWEARHRRMHDRGVCSCGEAENRG